MKAFGGMGAAAGGNGELRAEEPEKVDRVIFELPQSTKRQLKAIAAKRGVTVKQLMTAYVDRLIKEEWI